MHPKHAFEILFTGDFINAEDAARIGLINKAVKADDLDTHIIQLSSKIASHVRTFDLVSRFFSLN